MRTLHATIVLILAFSFAGLSDSEAIFGLFEGKKKKAATSAGTSAQEQAAAAMYAQAESLANAKNYDKARGVYKEIVQQYPTTQTAAKSQFKMGEMSQLDGKRQKAFEGYQEFIENYKDSPLFSVALQRQFDIVTAAQTNADSSDGFLGFGGGLTATEMVDMLDKIAANAAFSNFAPEARFKIGEIYRQDKEWDSAILAYQRFVQEYPEHPKAPTAQYAVAQILKEEARRGNNDDSQLQLEQEALEEVLIQFPNAAIVSDVRRELTTIESKQVAKDFQVAAFYEKTKQPRAAVMYYRRVLEHPSSADYAKAQERLAAIAEEHPGAMAEAGKPVVVKAETNVKDRDDYLGPPDLTELAVRTRPQMRSSMDDVVPVPMEEPDLPSTPAPAGEAPTPGLLLPPAPPPPSEIMGPDLSITPPVDIGLGGSDDSPSGE